MSSKQILVAHSGSSKVVTASSSRTKEVVSYGGRRISSSHEKIVTASSSRTKEVVSYGGRRISSSHEKIVTASSSRTKEVVSSGGRRISSSHEKKSAKQIELKDPFGGLTYQWGTAEKNERNVDKRSGKDEIMQEVNHRRLVKVGGVTVLNEAKIKSKKVITRNTPKISAAAAPRNSSGSKTNSHSRR